MPDARRGASQAGLPRLAHSHRSVAARASSTPPPASASTSGSSSPAHDAFDLPLAVALAGAAFAAYLHPVGAEGFEDEALSGTTTTFTSLDFLSQVYKGFLFVEEISATKLRPADFTGKSDPYFVMSVGASVGRTSVKSQDLNPKYEGERKVIYVGDPGTQALKVRVYDQDMIGSDDDLGYAMFPLKALLEHDDTFVLEMPLEGKDAGEGRIKMKLTYVPFSDFDPQTLAKKMIATEKDMPPEAGVSRGIKDAPMLMRAMVRGSTMKRRGKKGDVLAAAQSKLEEINRTVQRGFEDFQKRAGMSESEKPQILTPWEMLAKEVGEACAGFEPVAFIENLESDTQVWMYKDAAKKQAVIAYRGTEQVKWKDLLTDMNLVPTALNPERIDDDAGLPLLVRLAKSAIETEEKMKVHGGFLEAYDSVRMQVVRMLDQITGTGEAGEWRVLITGHSLGGALATLCAYELSQRQGPARKVQDICMYTYGAPRVGNVKFASQFNERVPDSWRITNSSDIVPSVPRLLGYSHVKHSVRVDINGKLLIQDMQADLFGEGRAGADVVKELMESVKNETKTFEEVYDAVREHEMVIFNSLVGGAALEQHMEEFYLETLRACVLAAAVNPKPPPQ
ncbi:hypothetical protein FOA52_014552 [Chlamydomonas sp. UWO 241]|nr:hypothetical protein FOA52_014552 [Chlamydomonas sp. UWO 241]